jgi:hypothetical protein
LVSFAAAISTFVSAVVIDAIIDWAWVHARNDPTRFDTPVWLFIFAWPFLVIPLFIPAAVVGTVVGVFHDTARQPEMTGR